MSAGFLSPWFGYGILSLMCFILPNCFGPSSSDPVITAVPPGLQYDSGTSVSLTCQLSVGNPEATLSWRCKGRYMTGINQSTTNTSVSVLSLVMDSSYNNKECTCEAIHPLLTSTKLESVSLTVFNAPSDVPRLRPYGSTSANEGQSITLRCTLSTLGNPPITWSWVCGDDILTTGVTNIGTQSELTLTANRTYNQRTCQCRATSPRPSLSYNRTATTKTITVYYAPLVAPQLTAVGSTSVDEEQSITLRCTLPTLGNPPITWSWECGYGKLTTGVTNTGHQSVLILTADRKYNEKTYWCRAKSPRSTYYSYSAYSYEMTSETKTIIVYYAPLAAPQLIAYRSVDEGQSISLHCTLATLGNPPITWSWVCEDDTPTTGVTNTGTQSLLTLTANRKYNLTTCQCRSVSPRPSLSYNRTSGTQTITVYYAPLVAPQLTAVGSTSVDEEQSITLRCTLPTLGNPPITWSWECGYGKLTTGVTNTGTQSVLTLTANRKYNQRTCQCRAKSTRRSLSYYRTSGTQTITVNYSSVITSMTRNRYVNEHGDLRINCNLEGNPLPNTTWFFVENNTVVKTDSYVGSSSLDILSANCLDHGNYQITAENGEGPAATRTIHVAVRCKPRLYYADSQTPDKLSLGNDESLEILVRMVMYPPATAIQWIFVGQNGESKVIQNNAGGYNITDTQRKNKHNSSLYKRRVNTEDFGYYTIVVLNNVSTFTRIYHVHEASVQETWIIVGSVVGSVAFIVVVLVILVIFLRRRYNWTCMIKIERKEENVKAADASEDRPGISETEQNVQGESQTYENVEGSSAEKKYENMLKVSKKQDEQDQTYCNTKTIAPNNVAIYEIMQGASASADNTYEDMSTGIKKQNKRGKTSKKTKMIAPTDVYVNTSFHK